MGHLLAACRINPQCAQGSHKNNQAGWNARNRHESIAGPITFHVTAGLMVRHYRKPCIADPLDEDRLQRTAGICGGADRAKRRITNALRFRWMRLLEKGDAAYCSEKWELWSAS